MRNRKNQYRYRAKSICLSKIVPHHRSRSDCTPKYNKAFKTFLNLRFHRTRGMKVNPCPEITFLEESLIQMACEASSLNSLLNPRNQRVEFHVDFLGTIAGNSPISHHELIISKVQANLFDFVNPWF